MQEWPDLTAEEVRATALDRLELHYEHEDARAVARGKWLLADHLCRFSILQVVVGGHVLKGELLAVGDEWVQLSTDSFVRPPASSCARWAGESRYGVPR